MKQNDENKNEQVLKEEELQNVNGGGVRIIIGGGKCIRRPKNK